MSANVAYEFKKLIPYSVKIECIAVYDDYLVVGNCIGQVLWYNANVASPCPTFLYSNTIFSTKPILQLAGVSGLQIVVCLSVERGVSVFEFYVSSRNSDQCKVTDLPYTKGANCFAVDAETVTVGKHQNKSGNTGVRLCVAVKNRLNLYRWNDKQFSLFLTVDTKQIEPRTLMWCGQSIIVGGKNDYSLVNVDTKHVSPLISTGTRQQPMVVKISDTTFGFVKDSQLIIMNTATVNVNGEHIIKLDGTPSFVAYDAPYLLVSFPNKLCAQIVEQCDGNHVVRQEIKTNNKIVKMVCDRNGLIYAMSAMNVWRLKAVRFDVQIEQSAWKSNKILDEYKDQTENRITKYYATALFEKKKYQESMKAFLKCNTDPREVIGLFSNVLSPNNLDYNKRTTDKETQMKIDALVEYLVEIRRNVSKQQSNEDDQTDTSKTNCDQTELYEAIDSALLICYLQTNDALVAPIIRLNHCRLSETETALKISKKYNELITLYQVKGQHREALEFLKQHSDDSDSIFNGPGKTIQYLQQMDSKDIDIVLEFSDWVLDKFPEQGLEIFTGDVGEVEQWPRKKVYNYLAGKLHTSLLVSYLEHVIHVWKDTKSVLHDTLINQYVTLLGEHDCTSSWSLSSSSTVTDEGPRALSNTKEKLLTFLERSDHYNLERILLKFPMRDEFFEERIKVLRKLGRHGHALSIYVYKLNDVDKAIEYCDKIYASKNNGTNRIYVDLLRLLNCPRYSWLAELKHVPRLPPNLEKTIEILNKYATVISPWDALSVISNDIPIHRISQYLVVALEIVINDRRLCQINRGLLSSTKLQIQNEKMINESRNFVLTSASKCSFCKKRFGNHSAFVRCLDGKLAHMLCYNKK